MNGLKKAVKLTGDCLDSTSRSGPLGGLSSSPLPASSASLGSEVLSEDLGDGLRGEAELKHGNTRVDILPVSGDPAALQLEETHPP